MLQKNIFEKKATYYLTDHFSDKKTQNNTSCLMQKLEASTIDKVSRRTETEKQSYSHILRETYKLIFL